MSEDRYSSYIKLKKESEYYEMSYMDKRKKDKAFGRFIKSAKRQMKGVKRNPTFLEPCTEQGGCGRRQIAAPDLAASLYGDYTWWISGRD